MNLTYYVHIHITDLMSAISNSYPDVHARPLKHIFNVKKWLEPHLLSLHNHSYPHIFKLYCGVSGEVEMKYKLWSDSPWQPSGRGIQLFRVLYTN